MVRFSKQTMILSRIGKLKETVKIDTQQLRGKALKTLEGLFDMTKGLAQNENLTLKQRQMWTRIAAYICQVINSVATGFDERQIDVQLDELERLVNEARAKAKDGEAEEGAAGTGANTASSGPC